MTGNHPIEIRQAEPGDFAMLADLEQRSDERFDTLDGFGDMVAKAHQATINYADLPEENHVWLAERGQVPVGFAYSYQIGEYCLLAQLSVVPEAQDSGIGSRLLQAVLDEAQEDGLDGVVLTTFRDVPWNAPFYATRGFDIIAPANIPAALAAIANADRESAWTQYGVRVLMGRFF